MIQKAKWIAPEGAAGRVPCHFRVEKTLALASVPTRLVVQVTCDGNYLLEVNGQRVGRGPARGTGHIAYYDEYDVAPLLHKGENRFSVLSVCMNWPAEATRPITPAVRMAIGDLAATDETWESFLCLSEWPSGGPLYTPQSGFAEWQDLNYSSRPDPARTIVIPPESPLQRKKVRLRDIPMPLETLRLPADIPAAAFVPPCDLADPEIARLSTRETHLTLSQGVMTKLYALASGGDADVMLPMPPDGGGVTIVVDFAHEVSGFAEIELTAGAGTVVDIVHEEALFQGDRLRADHTHTNPGYKFAERYILREGRQQCGGVLLERGFRLIQMTLRNIAAPVTIHAIRARDRRYPFARRASFFCGDYQLNRLWETAAETLSACTTDIFTDCPWRERLFYCNDFLIDNRVALKVFGDLRLHRRAFRMIFSQHRRDGLFTSTSPSLFDTEEAQGNLDGGKTDCRILLSGNLTLAIALHDYYLHSGDAELVRECLPQLRRMLQVFAGWRDADGVIRPPEKYWNFIDWSFELNGMGFSGKGTAMLNFLFIIAARAFLQLSVAAGEPCLMSEAELEALTEKTVRAFWRPQEGHFAHTDAPQGSAISMGMLKSLGIPTDKPFRVVETCRLVHALAALAGVDGAKCAAMADESLLTPELYYGIFLLEAMERTGDAAAALRLIRRHWGAMLDSGTPTLWENGVHKIGKEGFGGSASLCHGFSTAPAAFLQTAILGIAPLEPGFARFRFRPLCLETRFAQGRVPTPHGAIRCRWEHRGGEVHATLEVPEGCTAETPAGQLPAGKHDIVWMA